MNPIKTVTFLYYILFLGTAAVLLNICLDFSRLIGTVSAFELIGNEYAALQKTAGTYSIISFIVLLSVSLVLYYLNKKLTYIILSNILYIGVILYVFITTNKEYYSVQNIQYSQQSEYWLTVFMGIFYIIGAILVSTIAYITVRNYTQRSQHIINKAHKKN